MRKLTTPGRGRKRASCCWPLPDPFAGAPAAAPAPRAPSPARTTPSGTQLELAPTTPTPDVDGSRSGGILAAWRRGYARYHGGAATSPTEARP